MGLLEEINLKDLEHLLLSWVEMALRLHPQVDHLVVGVEGGELTTGLPQEQSHLCHSLYSLHGEDLLKMAAMETQVGAMVAIHHLHRLVVLLHALLHLATCLPGEALLLLGLGIILQASQWVDPLLHHLGERVPLVQAAVEHHQVDGACLHGEQHPHLPLVEGLLLAQFHLHQVVEVLHPLCHTGIKVEDGVVDKPTHSLTFLVPHLLHHPLAKHTR